MLSTRNPCCLIPACISNDVHYKVWDGIIYPFPKFNGVTVEVWEWISNFIWRHFRNGVLEPYGTHWKHNYCNCKYFCFPLENRVYFGDEDSMGLNPERWSIDNKPMGEVISLTLENEETRSGLGPISWKIFPSKLKFDEKLVSVELHCKASYRYKIMHMPQQLSCRGMSEILKWSLHDILDERGMKFTSNLNYCQTSNIRHTSVFNKIVDHSDVAGASPVGAAPPTSSFST